MRARRALRLLALAALPASAQDADRGVAGAGIAGPAVADPAVAALLATPGDMAYGAYLAGECTSCHQPGRANDGVPWITGHEPAWFVQEMHAYRTKAREHPIMNMIAAGLGDEEIAALAAYFATVE